MFLVNLKKSPQKSKLRASTVAPSMIHDLDRERMYRLMQKYYDSHSKAQFLKDLNAKHAVILLRDSGGRIQGFSTLLKRELNHENRKIIGLFSGDTIIEKQYWGQKVLGVEFLKFLWLEQIKNPLKPVYWFLISKGYKTYLLMANNFEEHYPRFESETPKSILKLMNDFYTKIYPEAYNPAQGLIRFEKCEGKLKEGVADITAELLRSNARVAFFSRTNPNWSQGDELTCVARMTLSMPLKYKLKSLLRTQVSRTSAAEVPLTTFKGLDRRKRSAKIITERRRSVTA